MYEYISGKISELTPAYAVIDCGGIGYMVEISLNTYTAIKEMKEVKLLTHYVVREDAHLLFGFHNADERQMFRLLIGVSGVGVATARVMLSALTVAELRRAIVEKNAKLIASAKGIGPKTAQRIALELADKVGDVVAEEVAAVGIANAAVDEALSALVMLGFPKTAADKVLQGIAKAEPTLNVENLIKEALKRL